MNKFFIISGLFVVFLISGCSLSDLNTTNLAVKTPEKWQQALPLSCCASKSTVAQTWWTSFGDAKLNALIDKALRNNNDLAAAAIRVQRAQLQAGLADTNLTPNVQTQFNASRGYDLKNGGASSPLATASMTLSYEVDLWGKLKAQRNVAQWEAQATEYDRQATAISLVGTTAGLYWQVGYLNQRITSSTDNINDARRMTALVNAKYRAGAVSDLDVAEAKQYLAGLEAAQTQLLQQRVVARNALAILFDGPPEQAVDEPPGVPDQALPTIDAGLPAGLLSRRPDMRAAEDRLRSLLANVDAVRTGFYPTFSLTGNLGSSSAALSNILTNPLGTLGAGLILPFLQWNTVRLTTRVAQTQYEEAVTNFRQTLYSALSEVENALSSRSQLAQENEQLMAATQQALRAEKISEIRYRAGSIPLQPVLDSKVRLRDAENSLALCSLNSLIAAMSLYKALGGGQVR